MTPPIMALFRIAEVEVVVDDDSVGVENVLWEVEVIDVTMLAVLELGSCAVVVRT